MREPKSYMGIDIAGEKRGKLTAIRKADTGRTRWICRCECGNEVVCTVSKFFRSKSCGCLNEENRHTIGKRTQKHGMTSTRLYRVYSGMVSRCSNPNAPHYERYGGRGIKVCDEWNGSFESFAEWAYSNGYDESKPGKEMSIDRINPDNGYSPDNCRWATMNEQRRNRADTVYLVYHGNKIPAREFAEANHIKDYVYVFRWSKKGLSGEEILEKWNNKNIQTAKSPL